MTVNKVLTLEQAARHIHILPRELLHLAQQGEIPSRRRGDDYYFEHDAVDEWAQRDILLQNDRKLRERYRERMREEKRSIPEDGLISMLFRPDWISASLASRTRPGLIRDMVALAFSTGSLYDDAQFLQDVSEREELCSTAMPGGVALMHARHHDAYRASESFAVFARAERPIHFGCEDGEPTDLFFLVCCTDDELHLRALSRICALCRQEGVLDALRACEDALSIYTTLVETERSFLSSLHK